MARSAGDRLRPLAATLVAAAFLAPALPACVQHHHHHPVIVRGPKASKPGPPPWAPAHGHRRKHTDGVDLVFDAELGVYVVVGHGHLYFHGDRFFRLADGGWAVSAHVRGPWVAVAVGEVPGGLRHRHPKPHKHGKAPPAKQR